MDVQVSKDIHNTEGVNWEKLIMPDETASKMYPKNKVFKKGKRSRHWMK